MDCDNLSGEQVAFQDLVLRDPVLTDYARRVDAMQRAGQTVRAPIRTPADVLGERAAIALNVVTARDVDVQDTEGLRIPRLEVGKKIYTAIPYLWKSAIYEASIASPMPRHAVSKDVLPHPTMWWTFEDSIRLEGTEPGEYADMDGFLVADSETVSTQRRWVPSRPEHGCVSTRSSTAGRTQTIGHTLRIRGACSPCSRSSTLHTSRRDQSVCHAHSVGASSDQAGPRRRRPKFISSIFGRRFPPMSACPGTNPPTGRTAGWSEDIIGRSGTHQPVAQGHLGCALREGSGRIAVPATCLQSRPMMNDSSG